jgi:hypothetical protein
MAGERAAAFKLKESRIAGEIGVVINISRRAI